MDSIHTSPRKSNFDVEHWETESPSPSHHHPVGEGSSSYHNRQMDQSYIEYDVKELTSSQVAPLPQPDRTDHQIDIGPPKDFSFDKRTSS
jgi:mlo protein